MKKLKSFVLKLKVMYSVALVMAFLAAENKNRQLKDSPQADFDRVGKKLLTKNFVD